jgi:hypothetical protein
VNRRSFEAARPCHRCKRILFPDKKSGDLPLHVRPPAPKTHKTGSPLTDVSMPLASRPTKAEHWCLPPEPHGEESHA